MHRFKALAVSHAILHPIALGKDAGGVTMDQDAEQDGPVVRGPAGAAVAADHRAQVETPDHIHHEARQVPLWQPFVHRWRHQEPGVTVDRAEVAQAGQIRGEGKRSSASSPTGC